MQTTLLNTHPSKWITTILEQLQENDQMNTVKEIAGPAPGNFIEYDQILKDGGGFWDDGNGGYLPDDLVLAPRREKIAWVHPEGV